MFMWCLLGANIDRSDTMLPGSQNRPNVLLHHVAYKNLWKFFFKDFLFIFQCVSINGFVHSSPVPMEAKSSHWVPWSWSCKQLWLPDMGAGNWTQSSEHETDVLNCWTISSASRFRNSWGNWQSSLGDISKKILEKMFWEKWGWLR